MLYIIGIGLWDEKDISLRALEELEKCRKVYMETYTNNWQGSISNLESIISHDIIILTREEAEKASIVDEARDEDVAILVPGDPLSATTHFQLAIECRQKGVKYMIIHSSSILTAIGEAGLQLYKFGRATTLVHRNDFSPLSPLEILEKNLANGFHTLVLLDIGMTAKDAMEILRLVIERKVIVCACLGSEKQKIKYGFMEDLLTEDFGTPCVVIVPGSLNFKEEEALELWI